MIHVVSKNTKISLWDPSNVEIQKLGSRKLMVHIVFKTWLKPFWGLGSGENFQSKAWSYQKPFCPRGRTACGGLPRECPGGGAEHPKQALPKLLVVSTVSLESSDDKVFLLVYIWAKWALGPKPLKQDLESIGATDFAAVHFLDCFHVFFFVIYFCFFCFFQVFPKVLFAIYNPIQIWIFF